MTASDVRLCSYIGSRRTAAESSPQINGVIAGQVLGGIGYGVPGLIYAIPSEIVPTVWRAWVQTGLNLYAAFSCLSSLPALADLHLPQRRFRRRHRRSDGDGRRDERGSDQRLALAFPYPPCDGRTAAARVHSILSREHLSLPSRFCHAPAHVPFRSLHHAPRLAQLGSKRSSRSTGSATPSSSPGLHRSSWASRGPPTPTKAGTTRTPMPASLSVSPGSSRACSGVRSAPTRTSLRPLTHFILRRMEGHRSWLPRPSLL